MEQHGSIEGLAYSMSQLAKNIHDIKSQTAPVYKMIKAHVQKLMKGGGDYNQFYGGGEDDTPDALVILQNYNESNAAKIKNSLVYGIARKLQDMGIKVSAEGDMETVAKSIQDAFPVKPNNNVFANVPESQINVCKAIASVINDELTPKVGSDADKLISMKSSPENMCRRVHEIITSLATSLNLEYLQIHNGVTKAMQTMKSLDEILSRLQAKIADKVREDNPESHIVNALEEVFRRISNERDQQMLILENYLKINLSSAVDELKAKLIDRSNFHKKLRELDLVPGTGVYGMALTQALSGLGVLAGIAAQVDKKLKKIGVSVDDYMQSTKWEDFDAIINKHRLEKNLSVDEFADFELAVEFLKRNFNRRSEFKDSLGGADDFDQMDNPTELDTSLRKRKVKRSILLKHYINSNMKEYENLLSAIKQIGPKLGRQIKITDKLTELRDAIATLNDLGAITHITFTLIGFYTTASAREQRESFIFQMQSVRDLLTSIVSMDVYSTNRESFMAMMRPIEMLLRNIQQYTSVFEERWGGDDGRRAQEIEEIMGGDDTTDIELKDLGISEVSRSKASLIEAINTFLYFFYIAKIRQNLKTTKDEISEFSKSYSDILGDAMAGKFAHLETLKTKKLDPEHLGIQNAWITNNAAVWTAYKAAVEEEFNTKKRFYKSIEALDIYMQAFTDGIISNPDDVKEIHKLLDGVHIISRWFTEQTGDDLAKLFELFPNSAGTFSEIAIDDEQDHYYNKIDRSVNQNDVMIAEGFPSPVVDAPKIKQQCGLMLGNYQALKNIISAFVRMGDLFGGKELRHSAPMGPTQIYKNLMDYLRVSCISVGLPPQQPAGPVQFTGNKETTITINTSEEQLNAVWQPTIDIGSVKEGSWVVEDDLFIFMLKAMSAKILTVIGCADLFSRPEPVLSLTPIRTILGGMVSYDDNPEIITDAAELYFRLPRLVEFYFRMFGFNSMNNVQISLMPDTDGVFAGIIHLLFIRASSVAENGEYSVSEMRHLIREINKIWTYYKTNSDQRNPKSISKKVLMDFAIEINRRYTVIKRTEWKKYENMLSETRNLSRYADANATNFAILPDETEMEFTKLAPSDRYVEGRGGAKMTFRPGKHDLTSPRSIESTWSLVKEFRQKIDSVFSDPNLQKNYGQSTYNSLIRQVFNDLSKTDKAPERFEMVTKLIHGSKSLLSTNVNTSFMFHETVVLGLNLLNAIYTKLKVFQRKLGTMDIDVLRDLVASGLKSAPLGAPLTSEIIINHIPQADKRKYDFDAMVWRRYLHSGHSAPPAPAANYSNLGIVYIEHPNISADYQLNFNTLYTAIFDKQNNLAGGTREDFAQLDCHALINTNRVMKDFIISLFQLTTNFDKIIPVHFPNADANHLRVDFSNLREEVENIFTDVKRFMEIFRSQLPQEVIMKYEDRKTRGSIYWLEEHFTDVFLRGVQDVGGRDVGGRTLDQLSKDINRVYHNMIKPIERCTVFSMDAAGNILRDVVPGVRYTYGRTFSELIFYDVSSIGSGTHQGDIGKTIINVSFENLATNLGGLLRKPYVNGKPDANPNLQIQDPYPGAVGANPLMPWHIPIYDNQHGFTFARSLMWSFNQLLYKYLSRFYDRLSDKMYTNLINSFANGQFSSSISIPGHSHPDIVGSQLDYGHRADPTPKAIVFQSLAIILRNIIKETTTAGTPIHLHQSLSDVPMFMRESFKAHLPVFQKQFLYLQSFGSLMKQIMQDTPVNLQRPLFIERIVGGGAPDNIIILYVDAANNMQYTNQQTAGMWLPNSYLDNVTFDSNSLYAHGNTHEAVQARLVNLTSTLVNASYILSTSISDVMKELVDDPLYLQTGDNSIQTYKDQNSRMPLMPLSLLMFGLQNISDIHRGVVDADGWGFGANDDRLCGDQEIGDPKFKFLYGVRKVINSFDKVSMEDMPGLRALLDTYNHAVPEKKKIEHAMFEKFCLRSVNMFRYLYDIHSYKPTLLPSNYTFGPCPMIDANPNSEYSSLIENINVVYSGMVNEFDVISVVENSYQNEEIIKISRLVDLGAATGHNRYTEQIINIIDMNIIPINIHGLLRSCELANIYNYSYTFDQLICMMFNTSLNNINALDILTPLAIPRTSDVFVKMLVDPYAIVGPRIFGLDGTQRNATAAPISRIFRGEKLANLDRPKFLSDQIFNKVLLCNLIPARQAWDSAGPSAAAALSRGRASSSDSMEELSFDQISYNMFKSVITIGTVPKPDHLVAEIMAGNYNTKTPVEIDNELVSMAQTWNNIRIVLQRLRNGLNGIGAPMPVYFANAIFQQLDNLVFGMGAWPGFPGGVNPNSFLEQAYTPFATAANYNNLVAPGSIVWAAHYTNPIAVMPAGAPPNTTDSGVKMILIASWDAGAFNTAVDNINNAWDNIKQAAIESMMDLNNLPRSLYATEGKYIAPDAAGDTHNITPNTDLHTNPEKRILTYTKAPGGNEINRLEVVVIKNVPLRRDLDVIGTNRFNTKLIRNLFFITNLHRVLRARFHTEMSQNRTYVVNSDNIADDSITEYANDTFDNNETYSQKQYTLDNNRFI